MFFFHVLKAEVCCIKKPAGDILSSFSNLRNLKMCI